MSDLDSILKTVLERKEVAREYYRLAPFYRLADQLILLRKERGLTQIALAEKAGTTQTVVSRLENVAVHCSLETVIKIAEALDAAVEVKLTTLEENQAILEKRVEQADSDNLSLPVSDDLHARLVKAAKQNGVSLNEYVDAALSNAAQSLQASYGENEPEYSLDKIKSPTRNIGHESG